jgi:hypothetical protein
MFDWLDDLIDVEVNSALVITIIIGLIFALFFFADPLKVGMDKLPFVSRLIGWLFGCAASYFIADKMLNK